MQLKLKEISIWWVKFIYFMRQMRLINSFDGLESIFKKENLRILRLTF